MHDHERTWISAIGQFGPMQITTMADWQQHRGLPAAAAAWRKMSALAEKYPL